MYCGKNNIPLEVEHIVPKFFGGTDRISYLTLACHAYNQKKGSSSLEDFLKESPDLCKKILAQAQKPLKDAGCEFKPLGLAHPTEKPWTYVRLRQVE